MARYWYFYTGSGATDDPSNYARQSFNPDNCVSGQTPCAIYALPADVTTATPLGSELATGSNILSYFAAATQSIHNFPIAPDKPYVYFKNP